jgi:hypothetical protein
LNVGYCKERSAMDGWRRLLLLDDDIKAVVAELGQVANAKGFPEKKNKVLIFF